MCGRTVFSMQKKNAIDENMYRTAENIQHLLHILFFTLGIIHFCEPSTCLSNTNG